MAEPAQDDPVIGHKLEEWLDEQGYPLEMEVASKFLKAGFMVGQSNYFKDPEEGIPREIDVVASMVENYEESTIALTFTIECKRGHRAPWVMFASDAQGVNPRLALTSRPATTLGRRFMHRVARREVVRVSSCLSPSTAFGITEAFRKEDMAFAAVHSATKAAIAEVSQFESIFSGDASSVVTFPVVVTSGRLFEYRLQTDGQRALREVKRGSLLWQYSGYGKGPSIVTVVCADDLDSFVNDAREMAKTILSCKDEAAAVEKQWRTEQLSKATKKAVRRVLSKGVTL